MEDRFSTDAKTLEALARGGDALCSMMLRYREWSKIEEYLCRCVAESCGRRRSYSHFLSSGRGSDWPPLVQRSQSSKHPHSHGRWAAHSAVFRGETGSPIPVGRLFSGGVAGVGALSGKGLWWNLSERVRIFIEELQCAWRDASRIGQCRSTPGGKGHQSWSDLRNECLPTFK